MIIIYIFIMKIHKQRKLEEPKYASRSVWWRCEWMWDCGHALWCHFWVKSVVDYRYYIHVRHKQITFISKEKKTKANARRTSQGFVLNMHLGVKWNMARHRWRGMTFRWWKIIEVSSYHGIDALMSYTIIKTFSWATFNRKTWMRILEMCDEKCLCVYSIMLVSNVLWSEMSDGTWTWCSHKHKTIINHHASQSFMVQRLVMKKSDSKP